MKLTVMDEQKKVYESGFLNYALNSLGEQGTFEKYAEWLKSEPVMSFTNDDHWTYDDSKKQIIYEDKDELIYDTYDVTLVIQIKDDIIFHSLTAGNSWFFKLHEDGSKLTALYVD